MLVVRKLSWLALLGFIVPSIPNSMEKPFMPVEYGNALGNEHWKMTGNRIRCGLSLVIPNYGIAYFEQYAAKSPHFILAKWQEVGRRIPATIFASPPMWKPNAPVLRITQTTVYPGKFGIFLKRSPCLKMLTYLSQGYEPRILYQSEEGFPVAVSITPVQFQKSFSRYQQCLGQLLSYSFEQVALSTFLFETDSAELNDAAKQQLDKVAEYFRADHAIKKIRIEGYTDDTGRKSYNNAISQNRAEAVSQYLASKGVSDEDMSVTWFGALRPVTANTTDEGKAANRRVIVRLIR